jgi:predicted  nucleic acid-binding Zn-ribbon protein
MQGSKKPPTSEVVETSKAERRSERNTNPPTSMRRDERAEPDDDDVSTGRIDVVNVDGGRGDTAATGMVTLRRELAKLHQQAAAVEKSLEDQRRDRSDSLDRLERATERVLMLETKVAGYETETASLKKAHEAALADVQTVRAERDDLALAVQAAKSATSELGRLKDAVAELRGKADEAAGANGALAKAKEATVKALAEAAHARADAEKAWKALDVAEGDAAMVGDQASKIRAEATQIRADADKAREEIGKARTELETARSEAAKARDELETARSEAAKTAEDAAKVREELTRAKDDNTRDRATARDRIDLMESALDDARAANTRIEAQLEAARESEDRLGRQLEAASARAARAESQASAMSMAHAALDNNVRRLREEVAGAFARVVQDGAPPAAPADASILSLPPEMIESVPPDPSRPPMGPPPLPSHAVPRNMSASPAAVPSAAPVAASAVDESAVASSPASKSVPPPPHSSMSPERASVAPPTYASVPPQIHASSPPDAHAREFGSVPPGGRITSPPPPAHASVPPAARGSIPPPTRVSGKPPSTDLPPADGWESSDSSPPTRRPGSAMPPPYHEALDLTSKARQELLAKLVDPDHAEAAAAELRSHPEWLRSVPPPALVAALASVDYDVEGAVFDLARAWDREPLCHSLIASMRAENDARAREHSAWLLKYLAAPSSWKAIADLARSDAEPVQLRRWLLEALDRLAAGRAIGWRELGDVVTAVSRHPSASLRDGVVGILVSLDRSDEKRRLLLDILRDDDDEVVLASAVNALGSVLPMELDPGLVERLLGHSSPRVQRSVRDLIERARQAQARVV